MQKFRPKKYKNKKYGPEIAERIVRMRALKISQFDIRKIINKDAEIPVTIAHVSQVLRLHEKDVLSLAKLDGHDGIIKRGQRKRTYEPHIKDRIISMSADRYSIVRIRREILEDEGVVVTEPHIREVKKENAQEIAQISESRGIFPKSRYDRRKHNRKERQWKHVDGLLPPEEDRDYTTLEGIEKLRTSGLKDLQDIGGDY